MRASDDAVAVEPDSVERRAIDMIHDLLDKWRSAGQPDRVGQWTREVKTRFCRVGRELGYKVCARKGEVSDEDRDYPEWLYDVTWLHYDKGEYLVGCPLVLETENAQNDDAIWDDWQRLIISNAAHRVMLFGKPTDSERKRVVDLMIGEAEHYEQRHRGDRYLFAGWSDEAGGMEYVVHLIGIGTWRS